MPVKVREAVKRLEAEGWQLIRMRGSHRQFRHPERPGLVTIAGKPSDTLDRELVTLDRRQIAASHSAAGAIAVRRLRVGSHGRDRAA